MQRLTGLDASFLSLETPTMPMHVAGLMVFDPSTAATPLDVGTIRKLYGSRLQFARPFRRRLVEVPLGLHFPLWIEDPNFHLDQHFHHVACPAPGGHEQLARLVADLFARPLDRSKPLWEVYVIEGLEHGYIATFTKVHHAAIDGVSGNEIGVALLDTTPEGRPVSADEWKADHVPSESELIGYALNSLARQPVQLVSSLWRTAGVVMGVARQRMGGTDLPPGPFAAPRAPWNAALTRQRAYAYGKLSLTDVKKVKNAFGCTVNDVVMALCAGALRRYLLARPDADPEALSEALVAMIPMSVRTDDQKGEHGNQVSAMLASLATNEPDAVARLRKIAEGMHKAKGQQETIGARTLQEWTEFASPAVAGRAARAYSRYRIADRHRPLFNLTISNVPGPPYPLYLAGARLLAHYPLGPINDGAGLNITVMSYMTDLDVGIVSCSDLIEDPEVILEGMAAQLAEYLHA